METRIERVEAARGGQGHVIFKHILSGKEMNGKCRIFAEITFEPGCSIGYHVHHGESETFYVLSGNGTYDDNGTSRSIQAGDVAYTPSGSGHAVLNSGSENLVLIALIILEN
ncbi:MAG: cupin domain-containing protein [Oscillospiraceae bacterium]